MNPSEDFLFSIIYSNSDIYIHIDSKRGRNFRRNYPQKEDHEEQRPGRANIGQAGMPAERGTLDVEGIFLEFISSTKPHAATQASFAYMSEKIFAFLEVEVMNAAPLTLKARSKKVERMKRKD